MPEQVALPQPPTLYAQLRDCESPQARADAALEFLRTCTGSEAGFLFLARPADLGFAASTHGAPPPSDLVAEARRCWSRELDRQPDESKTLELSSIEALRAAAESPFWRGASSEVFERRLLSIYRSGVWVPVGLVMLRARERNTLVPIRQVHIEALCNALLDSGDVSESTLPPHPRTA